MQVVFYKNIGTKEYCIILRVLSDVLHYTTYLLDLRLIMLFLYLFFTASAAVVNTILQNAKQKVNARCRCRSGYIRKTAQSHVGNENEHTVVGS